MLCPKTLCSKRALAWLGRRWCEVLTGDFFGFKACIRVTAIAKRFVFRLATTAKIDRGQLVFRKLFTLVIEYFRAAAHFIRTVFRYADDYIGHDFSSPFLNCRMQKTEHRTVDGTVQRLRVGGNGFYLNIASSRLEKDFSRCARNDTLNLPVISNPSSNRSV